MGMNVPQSLNRKTYYRESHMFQTNENLDYIYIQKAWFCFHCSLVLCIKNSLSRYIHWHVRFHNLNILEQQQNWNKILEIFNPTTGHLLRFSFKDFPERKPLFHNIILLQSSTNIEYKSWVRFQIPNLFQRRFHCFVSLPLYLVSPL